MPIIAKLLQSLFTLILGALFVYAIAFAFSLGHSVQSVLQIVFVVATVGSIILIWVRRQRIAAIVTLASALVFAGCMIAS
jgi:hypothetical protein